MTTAAAVPTATLYRAVGTGQRSAAAVRDRLRDAPDLASLTAELDDLAAHGRLRTTDPGRGLPRLYSLVVPVVLPGGVDRTARLIDLDRRRLEGAAMAAVAVVLTQVGTHARAAYRMGRDPGGDVATTLAGGGNMTGIGPRLARVATAANHAGRQRTAKQAQADGVSPVVLAGLVAPDAATETAASARYEREAQPYVDSLARGAADRVRRGVNAADRGEPVLPALASIGDALARAGVGPQVKANPAGPWAVRQLAAYLVGLGYADGQGAVLRHPDVVRQLSAYTYATRDDDRVRALHASLHGMTRPADDPVWDRVTPPVWTVNGVPQYGCRCWRVPRFGTVAMTGVPAGV